MGHWGGVWGGVEQSGSRVIYLPCGKEWIREGQFRGVRRAAAVSLIIGRGAPARDDSGGHSQRTAVHLVTWHGRYCDMARLVL